MPTMTRRAPARKRVSVSYSIVRRNLPKGWHTTQKAHRRKRTATGGRGTFKSRWGAIKGSYFGPSRRRNPGRSRSSTRSKPKSRRASVSWKKRYEQLVSRVGAAARRRSRASKSSIAKDYTRAAPYYSGGSSGFVDHFMQSNPRRRRNPKRRRNPGRKARRRNPRRRRNPFFRVRRRRNPFARRRRNPFYRARRRNPGVKSYMGRGLGGIKSRLVGGFKALFSVQTWAQAAGGAVGFTVAMAGPKLLAKVTGKPVVQRGFAGVATSVGSTLLASTLAGVVSGTAARTIFAGGLIGNLILIFSAISHEYRAKVVPIEEALVAAALPTLPGKGSITGGNLDASQRISAGASQMFASLLSGGMSPQQASEALRSMGLSDYLRPGQLTARKGVSDYFAPPAGAFAPPAGAKHSDYFQKSENF